MSTKPKAERIIDAECKKKGGRPEKSRERAYIQRVLRAASGRLTGASLEDDDTSLVHEGERWTVRIPQAHRPPIGPHATSLGLVDNEVSS